MFLPSRPVQRVLNVICRLGQKYSLFTHEMSMQIHIVPETASPHMSVLSKAESSSLRPIDVQEDPSFGSSFRWTCINPVQPLVMVHVWFIHDTWVVVREYDDGFELCKSMRTVSDQGIGLTVCSYTIASGPATQWRAKLSVPFRNPESGAPWGNMGVGQGRLRLNWLRALSHS